MSAIIWIGLAIGVPKSSVALVIKQNPPRKAPTARVCQLQVGMTYRDVEKMLADEPSWVLWGNKWSPTYTAYFTRYTVRFDMSDKLVSYSETDSLRKDR